MVCRFLILPLSLFLIGCGSSPPEQGKKREPPPVPVLASSVVHRDLPLYLEAVGTLHPRQFVELRPQASGVIKEVHFSEGERVEKGALLLTLEGEGYAIQLREAEALLHQHMAALDTAKKKRERYSDLLAKKLVPQQEYDELAAHYAQLEAQIKGDRARIDGASLNLKRCDITAPITGRCSKLLIHQGNCVTASQPAPLLTIANTASLYVDFALTERELRQLPSECFDRPGYALQLQPLGQKSGEPRPAKLSFISSGFDAQTGLIQLRGEVDNDNGEFFAGQHVRVKMAVQMVRNGTVLPQKAVKVNQQGSYLFVIKEDSTVEMRQIQLGSAVDQENILAISGVSAGEKVVTEGQMRLAPGVKVAIKEEPKRRPGRK